jgi:hypothetical protein
MIAADGAGVKPVRVAVRFNEDSQFSATGEREPKNTCQVSENLTPYFCAKNRG